MKNRKLACVVLGALALLGALLVFASQSKRRISDGFAFEPGAAVAYRLNYLTRVDFGGEREQSTRIQGTLNLRVVESNAARALLVAQIEPIEVRVGGQREGRLESALSVAFGVAMDRKGQIIETRFPAQVPGGDRRTLDALLRALQVTLAASDSTRWEATEIDAIGRARVAYARSGDLEIVRRKSSYASLHQPGVSVSVERSEMRAQPAPSGMWLSSLAGTELLQLKGGTTQSSVKSETQLELVALQQPPATVRALWSAEVLRGAVPFEAGRALDDARSAWRQVTDAHNKEQFERQRVTIESLLSDVDQRDEDDARFVYQLAAYLVAFPDATTAVTRALESVPTSTSAALLLAALQQAGTTNAAQALAHLTESVQGELQLQTVIALGSATRPTSEGAQALVRLASQKRDPRLAATAWLALGAMTHRADDELRQTLAGTLRARLDQAEAPEDERLALRSLQNAQVALPRARIVQSLDNPDPGVRTVAAELMGDSTDPMATATLVHALREETNSTVRGALVDAIIHQPTTMEQNAALTEALGDVRLPGELRARVVTALSGSRGRFHENDGLLQHQLESETERTVISAIVTSLRDKQD